jgi:hypothetical protein
MRRSGRKVGRYMKQAGLALLMFSVALTAAGQKPTDDKVLHDLSDAEMQLYHADMEAAKVESQLSASEERMAVAWIVTAAALLGVGIITPLVVFIRLRRPPQQPPKALTPATTKEWRYHE